MSACVAIQGERGSFSHQAAQQLLGRDSELLCCGSFPALFDALAQGVAASALVPVENTLAGPLQENLDRVAQGRFALVGECELQVEQCLIARPGAGLGSVRRVASHPVALAQCRAFFARHPQLEAVAVHDTAGAVRDLMQGPLLSQAALGPRLAAELYGAQVLQAGVQDEPWNVTRFLLLARTPQTLGPPEKTSLLLRLPQAPGTLHRALGALAVRGLDLTRIASRPVAGPPWELAFWVDVLGDPAGSLGAALEELRGMASELRVLGSYPQARPAERPPA